MGDGSPPRSLSHTGIWRRIGCQLPDAILHSKRSCRPRSRAVQHLAITGLNEILRTTYSPKTPGEQLVNKLYRPITPAAARVHLENYSQPQAPLQGRGE